MSKVGGSAKNLVPAHPPSKADPALTIGSALFSLALALGLPLEKFINYDEFVWLVMGVTTLGAFIRTLAQRIAAAKG